MFLSHRMNEFEFQSVESIDVEEEGFDGMGCRYDSSMASSWLLRQTDFEALGSIGGEFDRTASRAIETFEFPNLTYENRLSESTIGFGSDGMSVTSRSSFVTLDVNEFYTAMDVELSSFSEGDHSMTSDSVIHGSDSLCQVEVPVYEFSSKLRLTTMDLGSGSTLQLTETQDVMASSSGGFALQSQATEMSCESAAIGLTESIQMTHFEVNIGNLVMTATKSEAVTQMNGMSFFQASSLASVSLEMPVDSIFPASGFSGSQRLNSQSTAMSLGLGDLQFGFQSTEVSSAGIGGRFGGLFSNFISQSGDVSLAIG